MAHDAELLRRYAEYRDEEAFTVLVRTHLNLVYATALRRLGGDAHRAEDVAQQVFTRMARNAGKLSRHATLTGWLHTATRHAIIDFMRAEHRRKSREEEAQRREAVDASEFTDVDWRQLQPVLDDALDALSERDRDAILRRFFEGQTFADIGSALCLSDDAVRMRVERALDKLRAQLVRRGVTSSSVALALALASQPGVAAPAALFATVTDAVMAGTLTAAGATSAGLFAFMSTTKFTAGVAAIVLLLALGATMHEVLARRDAQRALAETYNEVAALSARLQQLRDHDSRAKKSEAGQAGVASDSASQNAEAEIARPTAPPTPEELAAAGRAFMERHPEVRQALLERAHARITAKYGPFYRSWGLAPAQIAQFETLMLETEMWSVDGPTGKMWLQAGTGLTAVEAKNRVHAFLGDDGFAQLQEINGNLGTIRQALTQLASATYFTDTPLTAAQAAQITERALTMKSQMKQWYAYLKSNPLGGHSVSEIMQDQVKDILAPPQREALDGVIQQIVFQRSMGRAMAAASTSGGKSSP